LGRLISPLAKLGILSPEHEKSVSTEDSGCQWDKGSFELLKYPFF
jgi:hypothetical protein